MVRSNDKALWIHSLPSRVEPFSRKRAAQLLCLKSLRLNQRTPACWGIVQQGGGASIWPSDRGAASGALGSIF